MEPKTEPTGQKPINQTAILVGPDQDFGALLAEMGDKGLNQRFTVSRRGTSEAAVPVEATVDSEAVPTDPDEYHDYIESMRGDVPSGLVGPKEPAGIIDMPAPEVQEPAPRPSAFITEVPGIPTATAEQSGEIQKPVEGAGYNIAADDMIQRAPNLDETQQFFMSKAFLDALMASVDRGEVTAGGKVIDVKVFKSQLDSYIKESKLPVEQRETKDPFRYIPSVGGMRDAFRRLLSEEGKSTRFEDVLKGMKFSDEAPEVAATGSQPPEVDSTAETEKTTAEKIAELPIEVQRAIRDYNMYMGSADTSVRVNGYNRDAEEERKRAKDGIAGLPTAMRELAERNYEEQKES